MSVEPSFTHASSMDYTADASDLRDCIAGRFARWLRSSRESRQLTQEQLAERTAYLSVHAIKSFEQGIRCPSLWAVVQLRAALGLSCDDWFDVPPGTSEDLLPPAVKHADSCKVMRYGIRGASEAINCDCGDTVKGVSHEC